LNHKTLTPLGDPAPKLTALDQIQQGLVIVKYIYKEAPPVDVPHDRRRKWHGWEI